MRRPGACWLSSLAGETAGVLLVFARLGAALMLVPGFGEHHVLPRMRLLLALLLSLLLSAGPGRHDAGACRASLWLLAGLVAPEVLVGPAARLRGPAGAGRGPCRRLADRHAVRACRRRPCSIRARRRQGTIPGSFLSAAALTLLFAADFHHLLLRAIAASYATFPVGAGVDLAAAASLLRPPQRRCAEHRRADRRTA